MSIFWIVLKIFSYFLFALFIFLIFTSGTYDTTFFWGHIYLGFIALLFGVVFFILSRDYLKK